ncbi:hypothetical protein PR048_028839 [Dryococelus australis]|uniref:HAT C-terminal dimerisation domain-containing protein n=1 Tax=Dryococelus australis TaxID=614101 RepID=A0ABQ9GBN3_9NEOP|nr:hypothetical protein PR048_028839 [Dryococelus australis]
MPRSTKTMNNPLKNNDIVRKIVSKYSGLLKMDMTYASKALFGEYRLWSAKWDKKSNEKHSIQKTGCIPRNQPIINILLQVLATLPVSVVTAERTFSTLKRIKTWLRTTINEDCLIGLALLATHCDITINPDQVIDRFTMSGNRRLKLSKTSGPACTTEFVRQSQNLHINNLAPLRGACHTFQSSIIIETFTFWHLNMVALAAFIMLVQPKPSQLASPHDSLTALIAESTAITYSIELNNPLLEQVNGVVSTWECDKLYSEIHLQKAKDITTTMISELFTDTYKTIAHDSTHHRQNGKFPNCLSHCRFREAKHMKVKRMHNLNSHSSIFQRSKFLKRKTQRGRAEKIRRGRRRKTHLEGYKTRK